ncbi:unnamed protein product [Malus baccata var. baccata]
MELSASGLDNVVPLCIRYPMAAQGKTKKFELKSSLLHHIPKYHVLSMEDPNKHLKEFEVVVDGSKMQSAAICGVCFMQRHLNDQCPQLIENGGWETALVVGYQGQNQPRNDPYSNTYNPGWRDHPNFKWREPQPQGGFQQPLLGMFPRPYAPPQPPPQSAQTNSGNRIEKWKKVGTDPQPSKSSQKEDEKLQFEEQEQEKAMARISQPLPQPPKPSNSANLGKVGSNSVNYNPIPPNVPFPHKFMQSKKEESDKDILEMFRKVQVNIPLLDAIKQVPKYAKFLKELCTTRKRISNKEVVRVGENVSAILQRILPPKCKDRSSFTIPCVIGNTRFKHAMLDLGVSINVMPYSIYASMNLDELKNDGVIIQLAGRSNAYPKEVLVQLNHLIFPVDFYVLEMEDADCSPPLPILLGRPFMKIARTKIDVFNGTLSIEFDGEVIDFNLSKTIKYPSDDHSCSSIDIINSLAQQYFEDLNEDALETTITKGMGLKTNS